MNLIAASPAVTSPQRVALLRRCGFDIQGHAFIHHSCHFTHPYVSFGEHAFVQDFCYLNSSARISLGVRAGLASHVSIYTASHDIGHPEKRYGRFRPLPVAIGDGAWVGAGAIVLPGVTIGSGCVVGAGSVVTGACEADGLYLGAPARRVRELPTHDDWRRSVVERIVELVPRGHRFVFVDDDLWDHRWTGTEVASGRAAIPFPESVDDGPFPADDASAIAELERLQREGASHVIFAWPGFWWLDHYAGFAAYLEQRFPCVCSDDRVVAFDLHGDGGPSAT